MRGEVGDLRFEGDEKGTHKIVVNFVNADGKHIMPTLNGNMNINFPDTQRSAAANLILNLQNLKFEKYGEYSIDLGVNGRNEFSTPLYVKEVQKNK